MYIPPHFKETDNQKIISFMKENSFGIIISSRENFPEATHLPFVILEKDNSVILLTHYAKANPQWKKLDQENEVLIIFNGPNSYISPSLYSSELNVPTWNYTAVHAYGNISLFSDYEKLITMLKEMFSFYEPAFIDQWEKLPEDYKNNLLNGITGIEIKINRLEGKFKLSQNKSILEQENIIRKLESDQNPAAKGIAEYMKKNLP
jgi:transcriptional regulator